MNTKKIIGILLSLSMLISSMASVFAALEVDSSSGDASVEIKLSGKKGGEECLITIYDNHDQEYMFFDTAKADPYGNVNFKLDLPAGNEYGFVNGHSYTIGNGGQLYYNGVAADDATFELTTSGERDDSTPKPRPTDNPRPPADVPLSSTAPSSTTTPGGNLPGGSHGGGSSGGSSVKRPGSGSSVVIPGTTLSNNSVGEAILNPNLYQKYGATAANIATSVSKLSANTFVVNVTINGSPVSLFSGYDAVMIKVPYTSYSANPENLIVYNQGGAIVPRSLYKDGYMYVRTNNIAGIFTIAENPVSFGDISNDTHDWAMKGVNALSARTIINGVGNGNFEPNRAVTRAEFVKMIVTMFDVYNPTTTATFNDIGAEWYNTYIGTAQQLGITNGYEDGSFRPNNTITREEMSTMLYRAAEVLSVSIESANNAQAFDDDWNIQDYARIPVYKMRSAGILNGIGNNLYDPKNDCTRAQSAVAIYNMFLVSMK